MRETEVDRGRWGGEKSKDLLWLSAAVALVFLFLLPILLGRHGIFVADISQCLFPNAVFQARNLQQGIIPLWDPHSFAGGFFFHTRWESLIFYLPQYLAGLLGEAEPSQQGYRDLELIPVVLHLIWAALGAYVLGRWGLRLSRIGSFMLALSFSLSGSILLGLSCLPKTMAQTWIPWLVAVVLLYSRYRRPGWLVFGAAIIALSAPAFPFFTVQGGGLLVLCGVTVVIQEAVRGGTKKAARLAEGLLLMGGLGFLLAAPFWWSMLEGVGYVDLSMKREIKFLSDGARSVPWRWFATLFVPELFGSSNFAYMWGVAEEVPMYWSEAFLPRGMLVWFPAVLVAWYGIVWLLKPLKGRGCRDRYISREKTDPARVDEQRPEYLPWAWLSSCLIVFSILMLLGRHTPFLGFLYRVCPLVRIPYATRWYIPLAIGQAMLTGIGATWLTDPRMVSRVVSRRRIIGYLLLATLAAAGAVALPFGYWRKLPDLGWFIRVPALYWAVCVLLLAGLCLRWRPRIAGWAIVVFLLLGIGRDAWWAAYRPRDITWGPEQAQTRGPEDTEIFRFMEYASSFDDGPIYRTGYSRVYADNTALFHGGNGLLGFSVKPMMPRLYYIIHKLCDGWPYELLLRDPSLPFVRNMSVGSWWYDGDVPPSPRWEKVAEYPPGGLTLFRVPGALPRIFTHDRLHPGSEENLRFDLVHRDLREVAGVDGEDDRLAGIVSRQKWELKTRAQDGIAPEDLAHFEELQEINRIRKADFGNPNRVVIEIDINQPSMLVLTDVWHPGWEAMVDGRPAPIFRVNYVQRGIWLEKGRHLVRMEFRPSAVYTGRWFTLAGVVFSVFFLLGIRLRKGSN